jgi:hypothetical protein
MGFGGEADFSAALGNGKRRLRNGKIRAAEWKGKGWGMERQRWRWKDKGWQT